MREKLIENTLHAQCIKKGGYAYKFTSPSMNGMPDRLIILPGGKIAFAEIKTTGKPLRPIQAHRHAQLKALGVQVYTIDHTNQIEKILNEIQATPLPNPSHPAHNSES